jgi:hypothetical protein
MRIIFRKTLLSFIELKKFTFEQIILESDRNESFVELKNSNNSQF